MLPRLFAAVGLLVSLVGLGSAQTNGITSRAMPPDPGQLQRLNLKNEWSLYLPIENTRDSISLIQTFDDQLFIQTRTGLLIVVDARTGQIQWSAKLGNGGYTNVQPVAVNSMFVFASNVTRLYSFHRYSGVAEFSTDLGTMPTTGLAADESGVYTVLAMRPGGAGAHRIAVYDLPRPISVLEASANRELEAKNRDQKLVNPVDDLIVRYPPPGGYRAKNVTEFESMPRPTINEVPVGGLTSSRTPSLAAAPRVTPPYTRDVVQPTPSLGLLPSLRQPYRMRNDFQQDIQRTPSLQTIPPSVAAALALTDLRPRGVEPRMRWEYGITGRILFTPLLSPLRAWVATDGQVLMALSKLDKATEVTQRTAVAVSATPSQADVMGYFPLGDGSVVAIDLSGGNLVGGASVRWRANLGGIANRTPYLTEDAVFASGDDSGVARVDRRNGEIVWRSDSQIDRVLAVTPEFAYLRDRQGRLHVFDARRATNPGNKWSTPLSGIDLGEFNIPVTNTVSDRVFLAADNGLIVCLRDASAKYARPVRVVPVANVNPPPKAKVIDGKDVKKP